MSRTIEFMNFKLIDEFVYTDLYIDNSYTFTMSSSINYMLNSKKTDITIYEYFRRAVLTYMKQQEHEFPVIKVH